MTVFLATEDTQQLLAVHPNQVTSSGFSCPDSWLLWWNWASEPSESTDPKWLQLWHYYVAPHEDREGFSSIPAELRKFVDITRSLQLNREPGKEACPPTIETISQSRTGVPLPSDTSMENQGTKLPGMSPKKAHEVQCMSAYTSQLLSSISSQGVPVRHVVDIGAGQVRSLFLYRDLYNTGPRMLVSTMQLGSQTAFEVRQGW